MEMKITKEDVNNLTGKFIIQLNHPTESSPKPHITINEENWGFIKEKRLYFVFGLILIGFYYKHREFKTCEEFVEYFNDTNSKSERYHRLLTSKEIEFVMNKMKQENY